MKGNVLIIGASGDIGSAIAIKLGQEGYQLLLHYNQNKEKINNIRAQLQTELILSEIQADLSDDQDIKRFITDIVFKVDHLIFASGNAYYGLLQDTSEEIMDKMLSVHVKAPMLISKFLLPAMIQQNSGSIVVISSIWGNVGASNEVVYSTVKGAQNSFVKSLSKEIAVSGVSVNAVSPGFIDTKMNKQLSKEEKEMTLQDIPLKRAGEPSEIAHLVSFLIDQPSRSIHGQVIGIDGAW